MAKNSVPKITSAWDILRASLRDYRAHWQPYIKILAIVTVPANIITLVDLNTANATVQSYVTFASVIMNVALIWAIVQSERAGATPKVATAYYDSSAFIVRFLLINAALLVMVIPAGLGAALYSVSLQYASYSGGSGPEQILLGGLALILALPTLYLLVRYGLSTMALVRDNLRPIAALKRTRSYTLGRFWSLAGRLVLLGIFLVILLLPSVLAYFLLSMLNLDNLAVVIFNIIAALTVLPVANISLMRLYRALEHAHTPAK
jgi:hypothetical protein